MVNMHYCMGKLAGTSFDLVSNIKAKCGKCGMEKTNKKGKGCCHDSKKLVKSIVDQNIANKHFSFTHSICYLPATNNFELVSIDVVIGTEILNYSHAPPNQLGVPIYIADCSFLI